MIESVRLSNFLSHKDTVLELDEGVNVFVGSNGAGKSSVIDAITYALFGRHTRESDKDLVRRGAPSGGASVVVSVGDRKYMVERRLESTGRLITAYIREVSPENRLIAVGERRQMGESVSDMVSRILGLDYDRLRVAAIIQQGELDSLLRYRPAEFKELIDSIIGIERLDEAYRNMKDAIELFRERLRAECLGKYDDMNYSQLLADIEGTKKKLEEVRSNAQDAGAKIGEARMRLEEANRALLELEPRRKAWLMAEELRAVLKNYVEKAASEMERRASDLMSTAKAAKEYLQLSLKLEESEQRLKEAERRSEELRTRVERLAAEAEELKQISEIIESLEKELEDSTKNKERIEAWISKAKGELEGLKAPLPSVSEEEVAAELEDLRAKKDRAVEQRGSLIRKIGDYRLIAERGRCPTCGSDAKTINVEEKLEAAQLQLKEVEKDLEELERRIGELEKLRDEAIKAREMRKRAELLEARIAEESESIKDLEARISSIKAKLEEKRKRAEEIKASPAELQSARLELSKALEEERAIRSAVERMRAARAWLNEKGISTEEDVKGMEEEARLLLDLVARARSPRSLDDMAVDEHAKELVLKLKELEASSAGYSEEEYEKAKLKRDELMKLLESLEASLKHYQEAASELEEDLRRLEEARIKVESAAKYIKLFETIRNEVFNRDGAVATSFRSWAIREISAYASEYVRRFGIGITEIKLEEAKRSVELKCFTGGGEVPVESLSGGEKVAVALALRFGIARLMGGGSVDFIVLDEPTVYLDEERKRTLVGIISGFSAGQGPLRQMIIITHDREIFEGASVDAVFRFEKVDGVTRVSKT